MSATQVGAEGLEGTLGPCLCHVKCCLLCKLRGPEAEVCNHAWRTARAWCSRSRFPCFHRDHLHRSAEGGRYDLGSSGGQSAGAMAVQEDRRPGEEKKVRFPPPKVWDPEANISLCRLMFLRTCRHKQTGIVPLSLWFPHLRRWECTLFFSTGLLYLL